MSQNTSFAESSYRSTEMSQSLKSLYNNASNRLNVTKLAKSRLAVSNIKSSNLLSPNDSISYIDDESKMKSNASLNKFEANKLDAFDDDGDGDDDIQSECSESVSLESPKAPSNVSIFNVVSLLTKLRRKVKLKKNFDSATTGDENLNEESLEGDINETNKRINSYMNKKVRKNDVKNEIIDDAKMAIIKKKPFKITELPTGMVYEFLECISKNKWLKAAELCKEIIILQPKNRMYREYFMLLQSLVICDHLCAKNDNDSSDNADDSKSDSDENEKEKKRGTTTDDDSDDDSENSEGSSNEDDAEKEKNTKKSLKQAPTKANNQIKNSKKQTIKPRVTQRTTKASLKASNLKKPIKMLNLSGANIQNIKKSNTTKKPDVKIENKKQSNSSSATDASKASVGSVTEDKTENEDEIDAKSVNNKSESESKSETESESDDNNDENNEKVLSVAKSSESNKSESLFQKEKDDKSQSNDEASQNSDEVSESDTDEVFSN